MPSNNILIDWFSVTFKNFSLSDIQYILGLSSASWQESNGVRGYARKLWYEGINLHFGGEFHDDIWLEMSGTGCRTYESYGANCWPALIDTALHDGHITRCDVAYDDTAGLLDIDIIYFDTFKGDYVSKAKAFDLRYSNKGKTIYIGSESSDVLIRIYDKAAERNCDEGTHWVRVELQLRDDRAAQFLSQSGDIGSVYSGVMANYLRYIDDDGSDSNRWRLPIKKYWSDFLCDADRIKLWIAPGTDYNIMHCEDFVFRQAGSAVFTLLCAYGDEKFFTRLNELRPKQLNPKYEKILRDCVNSRGNL